MKQHTPPINIILLGDPAAGKATQAAFLVKHFPLYDFDMGKELRILKRRDSKVKKLLEGSYDKGNLTQTDLVRSIHKEKILSAPKTKGILFDGTPKMVGEARLIEKWLKQTGRTKVIFIYLSIPMAETVKRMSGRVEYFKGKFSKRSDDNIQALHNRVKYYRKNVAAVITFFKTRHPYKKISGLGTTAEVHKRITSFLSQHH